MSNKLVNPNKHNSIESISKENASRVVVQKEGLSNFNNDDPARGIGLSVERLKEEHDFRNYLKLLQGFSKRYCVVVAAMDTPWGPDFNEELTGELRKIGLEVNLYGAFRMAYIGVINAGEKVFEDISKDPIERTIEVDGHRFDLLSVGFDMERSNGARIIIDGKGARSMGRGLTFFVYDLVTGTILDDVSFDTFVPSFPCKRMEEEDGIIQEFLKRNPGVSICCFGTLPFPTQNLTPNEEFIRKNAISRAHVVNMINEFSSALENYYPKSAIPGLFTVPGSYHGADGVRRFEDMHDEHLNIAGGHRITTDQPSKRGRTVFMVGGCRVFGIGVYDEHTIASELQRLFNQKYPEENVVVQNYGYFLAETDSQRGEELAVIRSLPVKPGDIVLYLCGAIKGVPYLNTSNNSGRKGEEIFYDQMHYTPDGNRLMAEGLLNELEKNDLLSGGQAIKEAASKYGFDNDTAGELREYKRILTEYYDEMFKVDMGCVVMNCNPFTLGHRYLIEEALKQCKFLVIFVVEEDQSDFTFDERLDMVDAGVSDLSNVVVIPSGRFIISSLTFSEYFNKSELQDRVIDPSMDVNVFAGEIAPCLHICKRFAGEEPLDSITRQYNETMARILPEYGIEFIEIPRYEKDGKTVSASYVRKLMKEGNLEAIRPFVPESTYAYLSERKAKL